MSSLRLILGGARSGKSAFAEELAESVSREHCKSKIYIATGQAFDSEMEERIEHHKKERDESWLLVETPVHLAKTLSDYDSEENIILIDCLTLWLSNCLHQKCFINERDSLLALLPMMKADVLFVSNEVGSGVVPLGELSREFVDQSGFLHQKLAKISQRVTLVVAGLPLDLK